MTAPTTTAGGQSIAERRLRLGASEFASALDVDPYRSGFTLFCEKTGAIEPDDLSEVEHVQWGVNLEQPILSEFAKRTGRVVRFWPQDQFERHDEYSFLSCTPDAFQADATRSLEGVAQVKNTGEYSRKLWADGPPLHVQVQVQGEMLVTGATWGSIIVLIGGNKLRYFDVDRNDSFIGAMVPRLTEFWDRVQSGNPPSPDGSAATARALAKLYPGDNGGEINLPPESAAWDQELAAVKVQLKELSAREQALKNQIAAAIGDNTLGVLPDGSAFSYKLQQRAEYMVKPTSFRVLRKVK